MITRIDPNPLFNGDFFPKAVEKYLHTVFLSFQIQQNGHECQVDDKGQSEPASDQRSPELDMISGASASPSISSEKQVRWCTCGLNSAQ